RYDLFFISLIISYLKEQKRIAISRFVKLVDYAEYCISKRKLSVGVISPYKGQVGLIQEKNR
ncbi:putative 2-phosphosulfolactate phosphatase, partial [Bienertia sinuspersici]